MNVPRTQARDLRLILFFFLFFFVCVLRVCMCMCVPIHVCVCMWSSEVYGLPLLLCTLFFEREFLTKPEIHQLARLLSWRASVSLLSAPYHVWVFTWVLGMRTQVFVLIQ